MKKILFSLALSLFVGVSLAAAQPRPAEKAETPKTAPRAVAPETIPAKYEGGMFGFDEKWKHAQIDD